MNKNSSGLKSNNKRGIHYSKGKNKEKETDVNKYLGFQIGEGATFSEDGSSAVVSMDFEISSTSEAG